ATADVDELPEDSPFHAVVDDDHFVLARLRFAAGDALLPAVRRLGRDAGGQILAFHPRRLSRPLDQRLRRRAAAVDDALLRPHGSQDADESPGVDALDADQAVALEEMRQRLLRAPVRGFPADPARDQARRLGRLRLLVSEVDAVVAHLADGERHELSGVGRIGEDLLIAGMAGVENDFVDRFPLGPDPRAYNYLVPRDRPRCRL